MNGGLIFPMINYLRNGELPEDDKTARSIVLLELDDGVLYYENSGFPGRYCVVVPVSLLSGLGRDINLALMVTWGTEGA